ncbi:hypothetical protein HAX54_048106 [Datura stramonium]|uniref:Uncharacterized protein n=1 Tax=Datura stramonium TaxID=4076 RepID=A0ABS8RR38_DATST|nr:hypothetical protein [Datura stramonium]
MDLSSDIDFSTKLSLGDPFSLPFLFSTSGVAADHHFTTVCCLISPSQELPLLVGNLCSPSKYTKRIVSSSTKIHDTKPSIFTISTNFRISEILVSSLSNS